MLDQAGARNDLDDADVFICAATAGDRTSVERMLGGDPALRDRARERRPEQIVRAAANNDLDAAAVLIELGFDVNALDRTSPLHVTALHEAGRRGNMEMIRLLLEHGADPDVTDSGYHATPGGWAEHFGMTEAHQYLAALEAPPSG
jgi:ankyrin repeat protein